MTLGCPGGHVLEHGHVAYQIDGDDEQNRMKVNFSPLGQSGDLGVRGQKVNFKLQSQFQRILYISLCVFSQIKDRYIMNGIFTLLPGTCSRGGTLGCWGEGAVKNISLWICDGAPSTTRSNLGYGQPKYILHW